MTNDNLKAAAAARLRAEQAFQAEVEKERQRLMRHLREARERHKLTQDQVAQLAGVSRGQIANGESGKEGVGFSMETFIGYAAALGLRITFEEES